MNFNRFIKKFNNNSNDNNNDNSNVNNGSNNINNINSNNDLFDELFTFVAKMMLLSVGLGLFIPFIIIILVKLFFGVDTLC